MRKYFTTKNITDKHYEGLAKDQARILFLIASAGADGITDEQLAGYNADGNPVAEGDKPLKVKTALLATGLVLGEKVPTERKGSERTYQYTGLAISDSLSPALRRVGRAVALQGTGTKSQFAAKYKEEGANNGVEMDDAAALKAVNGVWLRLQDLGIVQAVKKTAAADAPASDEGAAEE